MNYNFCTINHFVYLHNTLLSSTQISRNSKTKKVKCHECTTERKYKYSATPSLASPLDWVVGQRRAAGIFLPGKSPSTPLAWVGRRADFDECGKFRLHWVSNSEPSR
jgi:hypothetical protein